MSLLLVRRASSFLASVLVVACCGAPPATGGTTRVHIGRDEDVRAAVMAAIGPGKPVRSVVLFGLDEGPNLLERHEQLGQAVATCGYRWYQEREMLLSADMRIGVAMREPKVLESASGDWVSWPRIRGQLWAHGIEFACLVGGNSPVVNVPADDLERAQKVVAEIVDPRDE